MKYLMRHQLQAIHPIMLPSLRLLTEDNNFISFREIFCYNFLYYVQIMCTPADMFLEHRGNSSCRNPKCDVIYIW